MSKYPNIEPYFNKTFVIVTKAWSYKVIGYDPNRKDTDEYYILQSTPNQQSSKHISDLLKYEGFRTLIKIDTIKKLDTLIQNS